VDGYRIGHITLQVELQKLNEQCEVVDKVMVPMLVFLGAQIPQEMKDLIFSKLQQPTDK
jgi:hypothetical protein